MNPALHKLTLAAAIVAFVVIVLGAYVRLSHAGLGCPDWPGCYGQITWPVESQDVADANRSFPERPVEAGKAWKEMVHRYLAGTLVLLVAAINILAWKQRPGYHPARLLAGMLFALILFQAALGMWTVTLKLLPVVVMAHLLGGLATFSLLLWLAWRSGIPASRPEPGVMRPFKPLIITALLALVIQLALGGWTSANYAAMVCPDFPTCQGQAWPDMNFRDGFVMWREIGVDYEGGVLDLASRTAIHVTHRIGALVSLLVLGALSLLLLNRRQTRAAGALLATLLIGQVTLGTLNVLLFLPLPNAVAHNAVGALLLACTLWLLHRATLRDA